MPDANQKPRLSNHEAVRKVCEDYVDRDITPGLLRRLERDIERATGKPAWCDIGLNPEHIVPDMGIRIVFMEPDYTIQVGYISDPSTRHPPAAKPN